MPVERSPRALHKSDRAFPDRWSSSALVGCLTLSPHSSMIVTVSTCHGRHALIAYLSSQLQMKNN